MSLQTSSHPKARSLIVFLLSVISLGSILTQFSDIQDEVRDLPRLVRAVDEVSALDHIHNSSNDFQNHDIQISRTDFSFCRPFFCRMTKSKQNWANQPCYR